MVEQLTADTVLINGVVYTADAHNTICQAVAVREDKIIFVGNNEQVTNYIGNGTKTIDLQAKMLLPGFIDSHTHPPGIALYELHEVQLFGINTLEGYLAAVEDFINRRPDIKGVFGQGWIWGAFSGEDAVKGPRKEYLDNIAADIPVILRAMDGHTWWCNSQALFVSGITKDTKAPEGGIIEKDEATGELWGTVKESAISLVLRQEYTLEQYVEGLLLFQKKMHSLGITGVLSVMGRYNPAIMEAWNILDKQGSLALHARGAVALQPDESLQGQLEHISILREKYRSSFFEVTAVKFFADGVVEGATSYLLKPYAPKAGKGIDHCGELLWDITQLTQAFYMTNSRGFQIHVHSTGDAATHSVLNALGEVKKKLPADNFRNTITHLQLVAPEDLPRFEQLGVIASVQPYWHFKAPNWWENVDYRILGERAKYEYPLQSFLNHGATIASSSDYTTTPLPNPLFAIRAGATRNIYNERSFAADNISDADDERHLLNKLERVSVADMIKSFTINGAYSLFIDHLTGSIEPGKQADFVVIDKNLLSINPIDIDSAKVIMTFFAGKQVYALE